MSRTMFHTLVVWFCFHLAALRVQAASACRQACDAFLAELESATKIYGANVLVLSTVISTEAIDYVCGNAGIDIFDCSSCTYQGSPGGFKPKSNDGLLVAGWTLTCGTDDHNGVMEAQQCWEQLPQGVSDCYVPSSSSSSNAVAVPSSTSYPVSSPVTAPSASSHAVHSHQSFPSFGPMTSTTTTTTPSDTPQPSNTPQKALAPKSTCAKPVLAALLVCSATIFIFGFQS